MKQRKWTLLILICLLCSACGFHLRGTYYFPASIKQLYVTSDQPYNPLVVEIKKTLTDSHCKLVTDANQAHYQLQITHIEFKQTPYTTGDNNTVNNYHATMSLQYSILNNKGLKVITNQPISATELIAGNDTVIDNNQSPNSEIQRLLRSTVTTRLLDRLTSPDTLRRLLKYENSNSTTLESSKK